MPSIGRTDQFFLFLIQNGKSTYGDGDTSIRSPDLLPQVLVTWFSAPIACEQQNS